MFMLCSPCQNSATCLNDCGNYYCICTAGFNGKSCETPQGEFQGCIRMSVFWPTSFQSPGIEVAFDEGENKAYNFLYTHLILLSQATQAIKVLDLDSTWVSRWVKFIDYWSEFSGQNIYGVKISTALEIIYASEKRLFLARGFKTRHSLIFLVSHNSIFNDG